MEHVLHFSGGQKKDGRKPHTSLRVCSFLVCFPPGTGSLNGDFNRKRAKAFFGEYSKGASHNSFITPERRPNKILSWLFPLLVVLKRCRINYVVLVFPPRKSIRCFVVSVFGLYYQYHVFVLHQTFTTDKFCFCFTGWFFWCRFEELIAPACFRFWGA